MPDSKWERAESESYYTVLPFDGPVTTAVAAGPDCSATDADASACPPLKCAIICEGSRLLKRSDSWLSAFATDSEIPFPAMLAIAGMRPVAVTVESSVSITPPIFNNYSGYLLPKHKDIIASS